MNAQLMSDPRFPGAQIHESSYVDDPATIGEGTTIWHFCHVLGEVSIGRNCSIGQNVMIGPRVSIGDGCKIQNNVSIYEGVFLEDDVFCGPSCVFTNVNNPRAHVSRKANSERRWCSAVRPSALMPRSSAATRSGSMLHRRRRRGDEGRPGFCADGGHSGPAYRMDEQDTANSSAAIWSVRRPDALS